MTKNYDNQFMECRTCMLKTGMPVLCQSCLHNRSLISRLTHNTEVLASAMIKFAPDLMTELVRRHKTTSVALAEFVKFMEKD